MYGRQKRQTIIVLLLGMFAFWGIAPAVAQDPSLVREIQRLRRELADIQRYVYKGGKRVKPAAGTAAAGDDPSAASAESVSRLQVQVQNLEGQMRQLTGQLEKFDHDIANLGERLNKLVADVDLRLRTLEGHGQAPGQVQGRTAVRPQAGQIPLATGVRTTTVISSAPGATAGEVKHEGLLPGQKVFGTISGSDLKAGDSGRAVAAAPGGLPPGYAARAQKGPTRPAPSPRAVPAPPKVTAVAPQRPAGAASPQQQMALPPGTPKEQYDYAFSLLKQRDVVNAESAFSAFLAAHPNHQLAGNAMYWLGETHYVRKNYPEAARVFLDSYRRYPKGNKAPDNLFKLGKSLAAVGESNSACAAFKKLKEDYPGANARILSNSRSEMGKLGCR